MAEIGLVPFARLALEIASAVLPRYRTRFSKHRFTQPQLLALLCLMRFEDWTFREVEVRLSERAELRRALDLDAVFDYTTLYRFLRRVPESALLTAVKRTADRFPASRTPARGGHRRHRPDASHHQHLLPQACAPASLSPSVTG